MLYRLAKLIIGRALREFFSQISVRGTPIESGPALIVGNHQNFALDSLLIALCFKRQLWSLGKATLFDIPLLGWFLKSLGVAPLYRKMDDPSKLSKNSETFDAVARLLRAGQAVMLFPEGISLGERALQPIKTGAARMALQAESEAQFTAGVLIQPVGITYSDLALFRSTVTIVFDAPIKVRDFKEEQTRNPREAVTRCTAAIEEGLRKVSVSIDDQRHARLVEKIAWLYRAGGRGEDDFERFSIIAQHVGQICAENPRLREEIEAELTRFEAQCQAAGIAPEDSVAAIAKRPRGILLIKMIMVLPFAVIAVITLWVPYRLIGEIVRYTCSHPVYIASSKFFLGMILFPVWTIGLGALFLRLGASTTQVVIGLTGIVLSGIVANRFLPELRVWLVFRVAGLLRRGESPGMKVARRQEEIIKRLDALRAPRI